ncbi:MAG: acyltransferase [Deltaproteobacteria bacterium]|nr:acyltransferase [Deltaproteobacteria bacterium]
MKRYLKKTKLWRSVGEYLRIPLRQRLLNWFVHRIIFRTKHLRFSLHFASRVTHADKLVLGKFAAFCLAQYGGCYLGCLNGLIIGEGTGIAAGVKIMTSNHPIDEHGINWSQYIKAPPVRIGDNCWLSSNVVILPGVELGDNVIVAAGAVVTKSFPSNCVIAGVPAKIIKQKL